MEFDIQTSIVRDEASPALDKLTNVHLSPKSIKRAVGQACVLLIQDHLRALPHNKNNWPSTNFYEEAARSTTWDESPDGDGVVLSTDNESNPGSMRQRFHGGPINMKDKLLTIPARPEFYGKKATDFDNLQFIPFPSGAKALVIRSGGTGLVNFISGLFHRGGAPKKDAGKVAYWLVESVNQEPDPNVMPTEDEFTDTALEAISDLAAEGGAE